MTREEFNNLIPRKTMVHPKTDKAVQYMYMGKNEDGSYQLCGKPYGYADYLIINHYEVVKKENNL